MKYLVVSDNHGDRDALVEIDKKWFGKVDQMIHCGDSELELNDSLWDHFEVVKGNCDYYPGYERTKTIKTGQDIIFLTHGHLFDVNMGLTSLDLAGQEEGATIVLYGHTHKLAAERHGNVLYLNSGSISQPRGQFSHLKTYAIIDHQVDGYVVSYYNRNHEIIPDLTFRFKNE